MVYIDDIVIYSRSKAEHLLHLQLVFDGLHKAGLRLSSSKSLLYVTFRHKRSFK